MEELMNTIQAMDTVVITVYNPYYDNNDKLINQWYLDNLIEQYKTQDKNNYSYNQLLINGTNICRAYHRPNIIGMNQYQASANYVQGTITFSFAGIKSYNHDNDNLHLQVITNLLNLLQDNGMAFRTIRLDVSDDFKSQSIKDLLCMRTNQQGIQNGLNSPFNQEYATTFYLEQYSNNPSLKALAYGKTEKEKSKNNIIDDGIVRVERSIRTTKQQHNKMNSKEDYINHIQNQLNKYLFVHFNSEEDANELKRDYELMINNGKPFSKVKKSFMKKIQQFNGSIISNTLTDATKEFLSLGYCENFNEKLKATYTHTAIKLNDALSIRKDRTEKRATLKGIIKPINKQQKKFNELIKKRWDKIVEPTVSTEQRPLKVKATLSLLKSLVGGSAFQHPTNSIF